MAERKFTSLRKRLDQLGYRQPLGMDSVPLVEKIFSDLIHTTESLKNAKVQLGRHSRNGTSLSEHDSSEPYRSDNAKLVRENNDLHLELIRQKEDAEHKFKDLKEKLRKLEHENSDLKFLNSQFVHKVRALEKDLRSRTEKIQELQEKNLHAVVETPGGRKKQIPYRRQRMDIDSLVTKTEVSWLLFCFYACRPVNLKFSKPGDFKFFVENTWRFGQKQGDPWNLLNSKTTYLSKKTC